MLSLDEYRSLSAFLEEKCMKLWKHENTQNGISRNYAQTGFAYNSTYELKISDVGKIIVFTSLSFKRHFETCKTILQNGNIKNEDGNAMEVLEYMYDLSCEKKWNYTLDDYIDKVRTESCCYIIYKEGDKCDDRVLRVDLFRKLEYKDEKSCFTGGLFHVLKHFTTDKDKLTSSNHLFDFEDLVYYSAYAFFLGDDVTPEKNNEIIIKTNKNRSHNSLLKFVFFREVNTNIIFIKTIYNI